MMKLIGIQVEDVEESDYIVFLDKYPFFFFDGIALVL